MTQAQTMIELVISACLPTGESLESRQLYDARGMSLAACEREVARWAGDHPGWHIGRWRYWVPETTPASSLLRADACRSRQSAPCVSHLTERRSRCG